jgi:bla regulator protein BlaR1
MLCILYVNAIALVLGIAGLLVERALPGTFSRRWVWCAVIAITMTIPPVYQANHTASVTEALEHGAVKPALGQALGMTSLALLDPEWWRRLSSYETEINRAWLTGSAIIIVWGIANAWYVARIVRRSRRRRGDPGRPAVIDDIPVLVTDSLGPATVGFWRSRVLIPRWVLALPGEQRRYVLRHEDEHRRAQDGRLLFFMSLFVIVLPWNLALWWQLRRLYLAVEVDCDNRVVKALGDAPAYGELLFKVAQAGNSAPRLARLQPAFLGGTGMLERRLRMLLAPAQHPKVQRLMLPIAASVLLFIVLSLPHPVISHEPSTTHSTMEAAHR